MKTRTGLFALAVAAAPAMAFCQAAAAAAPAATQAAAAAAAPAIAPAEAAEINKALTARPAPSAQKIVAGKIEEYCRERGITLGEVDAKGAIYLKGLKRVETNHGSPDFIRMRSINFAQAYSDAVAKYVMDKFGTTSAETYNKVFADNSSDRMQPERTFKSAEERISEKTKMLAEATLDEGLRKLGVTPSPQMTLEEKRVLAAKELVTKSLNAAIGSSAGLLPVQTFEGWDENGKYAVGCVIRGGEATETIAECLKLKQRPNLSRPEAGLTVAEAMPSDDQLVATFGVRMFFDKDGTPALLSFGQWGSAYTGTDEDMAEDAMEHAMKQAKAEADDQLTMFINSTISIRQNSERGRMAEHAAVFGADASVVEKTVKGIVDTHFEESRREGSDTMIGRSTVCEKVLVHPTSGQKIALCARMWSFGQYDAMKRIIERSAPPAPKPAVALPPAGAAGSRAGRSYDF